MIAGQTTKDKRPNEDIKFEEGLKRLEALIEKLEGGNLALEESLQHFEEGVKLVRLLAEKLAQAEKRVEILLKDEEGVLKPRPFSVEGQQ